MTPFAPGDCVVFKGGGPPMRVSAVDGDRLTVCQFPGKITPPQVGYFRSDVFLKMKISPVPLSRMPR